MSEPVRFNNRFTVSVPTTDWRNHPETGTGEHHIYGSGIVHHDLINTPFHGYMYDTAVIAHPLSPSDCLSDPRVRVTHIQHIMCQLRDIQRDSRLSVKCTVAELRARQDSIDVLKRLRERAMERLWDRYFDRLEFEALSGSMSEDGADERATAFKANEEHCGHSLRRDSVIGRQEKRRCEATSVEELLLAMRHTDEGDILWCSAICSRLSGASMVL